jgi:hypothetical protein
LLVELSCEWRETCFVTFFLGISPAAFNVGVEFVFMIPIVG